MYRINELLAYNCKDVLVETKTGHKYKGRCHVYCEFGEDEDTPEEYITINGGLCIDAADIFKITEN